MNISKLSANPIKKDIAICLSGGGLRATYFHLGVIEALRESKDAAGDSVLKSIKEIYAVSGGAITAAHLVKNWDKYTGTNEEFEEVKNELIKLSQRNIRTRVLHRWVLSTLFIIPRFWRCGLTDLLIREYDSLLEKKTFGDVYLTRKNASLAPNIYILSTNIQTGELCSFSSTGFSVTRRHNQPPIEIQTPEIGLSYAVAASSAFPPLFPPVKLPKSIAIKLNEKFAESAESKNTNDYYLTDGGIFDNLGFEKLYNSYLLNNTNNINLILISNASSPFRIENNKSYIWPFGRNIRATDILMKRIADNTAHHVITKIPQNNIIDINISSKNSNHDYMDLCRIRTDLDKFSIPLVNVLINHGKLLTVDLLSKNQYKTPKVNSTVDYNDSKHIKSNLNRGKFSELLTLFNFRDLMNYLVLIILFSILYFPYYMAKQSNEAKQAEEKAKQETLDITIAKNLELENQNAILIQDKPLLEKLKNENLSLRNQLAIVNQKNLPMSNAVLEISKYQIYIQFAGAIKRQEMKDFGLELLQKWPNIPSAKLGGERTTNAIGYNEVRYGTNTDKQAAQQLIKDINSTGLFKVESVPKLNKLISPNTLEIWVSRN